MNPYGYNLCGGTPLSNPPADFCNYFSCIASFSAGVGYVDECADGMFSQSGGRQGACSHHGGELRPVDERQPVQSGAAPPAASQESAVLEPLFKYWSDLQNQDYAAAFAYLTPSNQQRVGGQAKFLGYFQGDPLMSVTDTFVVRSVNGASATVDIAVLQTQGASTGCRNWSGNYQLAYQGSGWRIDHANLTYLVC